MRKLWITILFSFGNLLSVFGQDILGGSPTIYNSSFAGSVSNARISSNVGFTYDKDEFGKSTGYTLVASYDNFFSAIGTGIGITAYKNNYTSTIAYRDINRKSESSYSGISLAIAPKISLKGKYTLSPSLDLNYIEQYHSSINDRTQNELSSRAGILFNATNYYIGYSVNLFQSKDLYFNIFSYYSSSLQMGYSFQKSQDSRFAFTPQLVLPFYRNSGIGWPLFNLGIRYDHFLFGLVGDGMNYLIPTGLQIGWQKKGLRVLLSHVFTFNYNADLSLRYIINEKDGYKMF